MSFIKPTLPGKNRKGRDYSMVGISVQSPRRKRSYPQIFKHREIFNDYGNSKPDPISSNYQSSFSPRNVTKKQRTAGRTTQSLIRSPSKKKVIKKINHDSPSAFFNQRGKRFEMEDRIQKKFKIKPMREKVEREIHSRKDKVERVRTIKGKNVYSSKTDVFKGKYYQGSNKGADNVFSEKENKQKAYSSLMKNQTKGYLANKTSYKKNQKSLAHASPFSKNRKLQRGCNPMGV